MLGATPAPRAWAQSTSVLRVVLLDRVFFKDFISAHYVVRPDGGVHPPAATALSPPLARASLGRTAAAQRARAVPTGLGHGQGAAWPCVDWRCLLACCAGRQGTALVPAPPYPPRPCPPLPVFALAEIVSSPAAMSQIDVYVSQSFMDDPRARWLVLQEFRLE
mmetsp:Transcript_18047/g.56528  ORF Transcript_18047/g.56528 Transcript_18047/m.56528 type:complete len:163 (-) Transcript_18047:270-758(-)